MCMRERQGGPGPLCGIFSKNFFVKKVHVLAARK